ncbi:hypothetical protein Tco_0837334 [Tanacetum coccineum]
MDYAAEGRLRKMSAEKAWATIKELARYKDERWNDPILPEEGSINYKNPNIKQLLGIMENHVDTLMKDAISIMGRSENIFGISSNMMRQLPPEPSPQEAFKDLVMNFILDQEEKVKKLKEYMGAIGSDFMQLPSKVVGKLKEEIRMEENRAKNIEKITRYVHTIFPSLPLMTKSTFGFKPGKGTMSKRARNTRGQSSSSREVSLEERIRGFGIFDDGVHQMHNDTLSMHPIYSENVFDWEFIANHGLNTSFFESIHSDPFSGPQWANLLQINEHVYHELVREFFASIEFESIAYRYEPEHKGVKFRLGGEERKISLLDLGWRLGLYFENQSKEDITLSGLRRAETMKANHKDSTQRITEIDLFYLYCIYALGVGCNIPYWLTKYLKGVRDKFFIYVGMFVTRIARSFGLLTTEMIDVLGVEPPAHVFKKKSLIAMGIVMELHRGACYWAVAREAGEGDEAKEAAEEEAGGSVDMYQYMSRGY